jgi:hypothetical protein
LAFLLLIGGGFAGCGLGLSGGLLSDAPQGRRFCD